MNIKEQFYTKQGTLRAAFKNVNESELLKVIETIQGELDELEHIESRLEWEVDEKCLEISSLQDDMAKLENRLYNETTKEHKDLINAQYQFDMNKGSHHAWQNLRMAEIAVENLNR